MSYHISPSLSDWLHSVWDSLGPSVCVVANGMVPFFSMAEECSAVCAHHSCFIHSSVDGHRLPPCFSSFHFFLWTSPKSLPVPGQCCSPSLRCWLSVCYAEYVFQKLSFCFPSSHFFFFLAIMTGLNKPLWCLLNSISKTHADLMESPCSKTFQIKGQNF